MTEPDMLFIGSGGHVVAFRREDGARLWDTELPSGMFGASGFVGLLVDGDRIFAHAVGELFCLSTETGEILWRDGLAGLGYQPASLALEGRSNSNEAAMAAIDQARRRNHAPSG